MDSIDQLNPDTIAAINNYLTQNNYRPFQTSYLNEMTSDEFQVSVKEIESFHYRGKILTPDWLKHCPISRHAAYAIVIESQNNTDHPVSLLLDGEFNPLCICKPGEAT